MLNLDALSLCASHCFLSGCQSDGTAPGLDPRAREQLVSLSVADRAVIHTDNGFTIAGIAGAALHQDLITFDRPFVVMIGANTSGAVIFVGRIMDPTL